MALANLEFLRSVVVAAVEGGLELRCGSRVVPALVAAGRVVGGIGVVSCSVHLRFRPVLVPKAAAGFTDLRMFVPLCGRFLKAERALRREPAS